MPNGRTPFAIKLIAAILCTAALAVGSEFFIPLALAFCFHALLRPVVRSLERWKRRAQVAWRIQVHVTDIETALGLLHCAAIAALLVLQPKRFRSRTRASSPT